MFIGRMTPRTEKVNLIVWHGPSSTDASINIVSELMFLPAETFLFPLSFSTFGIKKNKSYDCNYTGGHHYTERRNITIFSRR